MKVPYAPAALLLCAAIAPLSASAQDAKEEQKAAKTEARQSAKEEKQKKGAPDQAAAMKAWQEFSTPGAVHRRLQQAVGSWTAHVKMWMEPGAPAQESDGTAEYTSILGGRFVEEKFQGRAMGRTFEGRGWTGYDNNTKKVVSTWIDDMTTAIMLSTGSYDPSGKTLTTTATMIDPLTKKPQRVKSTTTMPDPDHMLFEMWGPDRSGNAYKTLEIAYTRKK